MRLVETRYSPGLRQPLHAHEQALIALVAGGEVVEDNGSRGEAHGGCGELVVVPSRFPHEIVYGPRGAKMFTLELDEEVGPHRWQLGGAPSVLFVRAIDEWRAGGSIDGIVVDLVASVRDGQSHIEPKTAQAPRMRELARRFASSDVTVAAAARELGMHPVALARAFRRALGCSITCYRRRAQLHRAASLLAESRMALADVALESGFADQSHFCRIFKREIGISPSRYRAFAV